MNWKRIGRAAVCLLLVCCLVLHLSPFEVKAVDPISIGMGVMAGVGALLGIGAIMVGLGIHPGRSSNDFWSLADRIYASLPTEFQLVHTVAGLGAQQMLLAWYYKDTYFFHEEVIRHVNNRIHTGTVTYNKSTGTVSSTAPVQYVNAYSGESIYEKALGYYYNWNPTLYDVVTSYPYCTKVVRISATAPIYIWSDERPYYEENESGYYDFDFPTYYYAVQYNPEDGSFSSINNVSSWSNCRSVNVVSSIYETTLDLSVSNVNKDSTVIPFNVEYVEDDATDDGDDSGNYHPVTLLPNQDAVEDMSQSDALSGSAGTPDIAVDAETGGLLDSNQDNSWLLDGKEVGVDAEIAVSSMVIALGISPGSANTDFRALVDNVISELPKEYFYDFESLAYGNLSLLRCWLCDDTYYFTEDVLAYINGLLYNGSDTMDPIFKDEGFLPDSSKYPEYSILLEQVETWRNSSSAISNSYAEIFDTSRYLGAMWRSSNSHCVFVCSPNPISLVTSGSYSYFVGEGPYIDMYYSGAWFIYGHNTTDSFESPQLYSSGSYYGYTDIYTSGLSLAGDLFLFDSAPSLSDLLYGSYTVEVDGVDVTYYPVKLFETLEAAEAATQSEVQAGLDSSTSLTVDVTTGEIIDVLPGIGSGTEGGDETEATLPYPGTSSGSGSDIGSGSDTDTGSGPDTGTGSDIGTSSGSISQGEIDESLSTHRTGLLSVLRDFIEWLANAIVSGFRKIITWLADTLVIGIRRIIEWLADTLLAGIERIFVPSEDFLTAKVEALRARFGFADSIMATFEEIGDAFNAFYTEPPIIYMDLGSAESKYDWGDEAVALDLRWYERYKPTVDNLLSALLWLFFIWRVFRKLPDVISGVAGDTPDIPIHDGPFVDFGTSPRQRRITGGSAGFTHRDKSWRD